MERMRPSAAPMWMDICNNVDGDATPFPGHSAKVADTSDWQCRAPDVPFTPWNGPRFPQCTPRPGSESAAPSQTEMAACAVDKQMTTPRTNHETTQHILEQMLLELDRAPLITFTSVDGPPRGVSTQHNTPTAPLDAPCQLNGRTNYAQNPPARHSHGGQGHYYNSTGVFRHPPFVSCQYDLGGCQYDIVDRQEPKVGAVHHTALMSRGVDKPTCDPSIVAPARNVMSVTDAPSQMTRSLLELSRLVDHPPPSGGCVVPPPPPGRSNGVSNTQEYKTLRTDSPVEVPVGKTSEGCLLSCPDPRPTGSSVTPPPCSKPTDTALPIDTKQETHQDSRCKITTNHGSVYVDRQTLGMMNIDQTGRFARSPVIILERLQEDKVKTRSSQQVNKRRRTKPLRLLSYVGDSDSDIDNDDSNASDYVPSECDRYSHNEDREDSDGSILDPRELEPELGSDFSETSSDTAEFSTCDDDDNNNCSDSDNNIVDDVNMSCDSDTKESGDASKTS